MAFCGGGSATSSVRKATMGSLRVRLLTPREGSGTHGRVARMQTDADEGVLSRDDTDTRRCWLCVARLQ